MDVLQITTLPNALSLVWQLFCLATEFAALFNKTLYSLPFRLVSAWWTIFSGLVPKVVVDSASGTLSRLLFLPSLLLVLLAMTARVAHSTIPAKRLSAHSARLRSGHSAVANQLALCATVAIKCPWLLQVFISASLANTHLALVLANITLLWPAIWMDGHTCRFACLERISAFHALTLLRDILLGNPVCFTHPLQSFLNGSHGKAPYNSLPRT